VRVRFGALKLGPIKMTQKATTFLAGLAALASLAAAPAHAESGWHLLNLTRGVTDVSRQIYELHMIILWICVAIGVAVFAVMIYAIFKFQKSKGAVADTTMVHNTKVEVAWTLVPVAILVAMAVPAASTLVTIEDTRNTDISIKVTGFQWGWEYDYLEHGFAFHSRISREADAARQLGSSINPRSIPNYLLDVDNPLVVPAGAKVRLLVTSLDVIHAWWVPAFGIKKDAIPGFVNEMWFQVDADKTGLYRGQCTELCGRDHAFMPVVVDVRTPQEYEAWVAEQLARQQQAGEGAEEAATAQAALGSDAVRG
jgi:cytochrome c oxidase subunit II